MVQAPLLRSANGAMPPLVHRFVVEAISRNRRPCFLSVCQIGCSCACCSLSENGFSNLPDPKNRERSDMEKRFGTKRTIKESSRSRICPLDRKQLIVKLRGASFALSSPDTVGRHTCISFPLGKITRMTNPQAIDGKHFFLGLVGGKDSRYYNS